MGSAYLLPRIIGLGRATELLILGEDVEPDRAVEIGLASRVVEDEELGREAGVLARRLAEGPAMAYAQTKVLLSRELDMDLAGALELEAMTQALLMTTADHREFYEAFEEGRKPRWRGR
jgi:enoyl-CoA hydratase/carnithine racemase